MQQPDFHFFRSRNSDKPMAARVFAGDRCIGFVWRSWNDLGQPVWVTRLTPAGPDLSVEPTKHAAALVLWRIAAVMAAQSSEARVPSAEREAVVA